MKRRKMLIAAGSMLIMLACIFVFNACTEMPKPGGDTEKLTQAPKQDATSVPAETPAPTDTPEPELTLEPLEIPYFSYDELMDIKRSIYFSGYDTDGYWFGENSGSGGTSLDSFLYYFPEVVNAKRIRDEKCWYYMIDTDNDSRLFVFFDDHDNFGHRAGYPILIQQPLPYEAFAALDIGDPIEDVLAVDPAAQLPWLGMQAQGLPGSFRALEVLTRAGRTISTLHYLTDGVMRIDYTLNEEGEVVIGAMTYGADWKLANAGGKIIDYHILPGDLDF